MTDVGIKMEAIPDKEEEAAQKREEDKEPSDVLLKHGERDKKMEKKIKTSEIPDCWNRLIKTGFIVLAFLSMVSKVVGFFKTT